MLKIGFIGLGVMGRSMAGHLLRAGNELYVYTRTQHKAQSLIEAGAKWLETPQAVAEHADIVFTIVGYPQDVEMIYFGKQGLFAGAHEGSLFVDMTTSTPSLAQKIAMHAATLGIEALDAPVSGGDLGAQNATLTIMVGGSQAAYERVYPLLQQMGKTIKRQGEAGSGQHTKMANQIMIAGTMIGMTELLVYAQKVGLNLADVIETVGGGSAANWSLSNYAPRILREDYTPGFFVKHFLKDLRIALDEAQRQQLELPGTALAEKLYAQLVDAGYGDLGTQALIKLWWENV